MALASVRSKETSKQYPFETDEDTASGGEKMLAEWQKGVDAGQIPPITKARFTKSQQKMRNEVAVKISNL